MSTERASFPLPHRAADEQVVRAWLRTFAAGRAPVAIQQLKRTKTSLVCRLVGALPDGRAVVAKQRQRHHMLDAEALVFDFLGSLPLLTLRSFGRDEDPLTGISVLFLEDAAGVPYANDNAAHRVALGHWLGELQRLAHGRPAVHALPDRGLAYYRSRLEIGQRALTPHRDHVLARLSGRLREIGRLWPRLERLCAGIPTLLVHGDLQRRNIVVGDESGRLVPLVFDWEYAGPGFPGIDLAQLPLSGRMASPDLNAYVQSVSSVWPEVTVDIARSIARVGGILRAVDGVVWAAWGLDRGPRHETLRAMRAYDERLTTLLAGVS